MQTAIERSARYLEANGTPISKMLGKPLDDVSKPVFSLRRVRLNAGGYDSAGGYYGTGAPLYEAESEDYSYPWRFRARDRAEAKAIIRSDFPAAMFRR